MRIIGWLILQTFSSHFDLAVRMVLSAPISIIAVRVAWKDQDFIDAIFDFHREGSRSL